MLTFGTVSDSYPVESLFLVLKYCFWSFPVRIEQELETTRPRMQVFTKDLHNKFPLKEYCINNATFDEDDDDANEFNY